MWGNIVLLFAVAFFCFLENGSVIVVPTYTGFGSIINTPASFQVKLDWTHSSECNHSNEGFFISSIIILLLILPFLTLGSFHLHLSTSQSFFIPLLIPPTHDACII